MVQPWGSGCVAYKVTTCKNILFLLFFVIFNTIIHILYNFDTIEWGKQVIFFFKFSIFNTTNIITYTKG